MGVCSCKGDEGNKAEVEVPSVFQDVKVEFKNEEINKFTHFRTVKTIRFLKEDIEGSYNEYDAIKRDKSKTNTITYEKLINRTKTIYERKVRRKSSNLIVDTVIDTKINEKNYEKKKSSFSKISTNNFVKYNNLPPNYKENDFQIENILEEDICEDSENIIHSCIIHEEEINKIRTILKNHFLFSYLEDHNLSSIIDDLIEFNLDKGSILFQENDDGQYFYILRKGELEMLENNLRKKVLNEWECLGELALYHKCKRTSTVRALTDCSLFVLEGSFFREIVMKLNNEKMNEIINYIDNASILQCLDSIQKTNIASLVIIEEYNNTQKIINKGDDGDRMYIVKNGYVKCVLNNKELKRLGPGEYFGENSLIFDTKRSLDVISVDISACYVINRINLEEALGLSYKQIILFSFFKFYARSNKFIMSLFNEMQLDDLYKIFEIKKYKTNEIAFKKDCNLNKKIILIFQGSLVINKKNHDIVGNKGDFYGQDIININNNLSYDIIAVPDCISFEASWKNIVDFLNIESGELENLQKINKLKMNSFFECLNETNSTIIKHQIKKEIYKKDSLVFYEGSSANYFYLIARGKVKITYRGKLLRILEEGDFFGEIAIIQNISRTATVFSIEESELYVLPKEILNNVLDKNMLDFLNKKIAVRDTQVTLKNLYYISFLGKGKFGSVCLVHNKKYFYAIKSVSRVEIYKNPGISYLIKAEKDLLLSLNHPFIVKLIKTFKSDYFFFYLLEYINGQNFQEFLEQKIQRRNLYETKFYIASLLLTVDYLCKKKIVHRDIKPSNIMINSKGYLKLIDFGTAKYVKDYTYTVLGTPHYIAPEILNGKGYNYCSDFWSIGVVMFEIYYGSYPFGANKKDIMEIYKEISTKEILYPPDSNVEVNKVIELMLNKKVNQRVCNLSTYKNINFFKNFNWNDLYKMNLKPPNTPDINFANINMENCNYTFEEVINSEKNNEIGEDLNESFDKWIDDF